VAEENKYKKGAYGQLKTIKEKKKKKKTCPSDKILPKKYKVFILLFF
jgi:hypothetical protein